MRIKRARCAIHSLDLILPKTPLPVKLAAERLASGEWLLVMTDTPEPRRALQVYGIRGGIECLFGDARTRGRYLEDAHLTDPTEIEMLTAVLALTWICRTATDAMGFNGVARKIHCRREKSWSRTGLDALRGNLLDAPQSAATIQPERCSKRPRAL